MIFVFFSFASLPLKSLLSACDCFLYRIDDSSFGRIIWLFLDEFLIKMIPLTVHLIAKKSGEESLRVYLCISELLQSYDSVQRIGKILKISLEVVHVKILRHIFFSDF